MVATKDKDLDRFRVTKGGRTRLVDCLRQIG
jgi:hypothetical protein